MNHPLRHHLRHQELHGVFGSDTFGRMSEKFARAFGTPKFIVGQTFVVAVWITLNVVGFIHHWDGYPFILLNLMFSTQAAYAAPLILLAQTRQADRDKAAEEADARHREELAGQQTTLIQENTKLTQEVHAQTAQIAQLSEDIAALRTLLTPTMQLPASGISPLSDQQ